MMDFKNLTKVSPLVYVIVLTYNHSADTRQSLLSLQQMTYDNFKLLVVDNNSTDDTVEVVQQEFHEISLLTNVSNLGFAAGANIGIQYALQNQARFILLSNNDVIVAPDMLDYLVAAMQEGVAAVAPLIYYFDDPHRVWSAGFMRHPITWAMHNGARGVLDEGQWQEPFEVDYLLGCALLLDSNALNSIGCLDENYFFYYEDLDISFKLQQAGMCLKTVPKAKLWHKVSVSAGKNTPFRVYQMARSSVFFFGSHALGCKKLIFFLFRLGSAIRTTLKLMLRKEGHLLKAYWHGIKDGWYLLRMSRKESQ